MPRLTDSMGFCYRCGQRPYVHDFAHPAVGIIGVCDACLPEGARRESDGVFELPKKLERESELPVG